MDSLGLIRKAAGPGQADMVAADGARTESMLWGCLGLMMFGNLVRGWPRVSDSS